MNYFADTAWEYVQTKVRAHPALRASCPASCECSIIAGLAATAGFPDLIHSHDA